MQKNIFLPIYTLFILFSVSLYGQDEVPRISGVINAYTSVNTIDKCNSKVGVTSVNGFTPGMSVLIIQMKGATIEESNNDDFGKLSNIRNAGRYEYNVIQSISDGNVFLFFNIVNDYDMDGKVQIVGIPQYANAIVDNTLIAEPWDGASGGVVALKVNGTLTLDADIDVTGLGFRGGKIDPHENECTGGVNNANNYYYEQGNWRGAEKGEGVADYIINKELGRGPQANGGGGGNDHNAGGGGGANVTAGGNGGERKLPLITTKCKGGNPGLAGRSLPADNTRIFFGGGGGAGHSNNTAGTNGGNGGGIIIIQADKIVANNNRIVANGVSALTTDGADGAGGGGAGGTIVLDVNEVDAGLIVFAEGGNGGNADSRNSDECFGPGGGGGGGRVLSRTTGLNSLVEAGLPGQVVNSTDECNGQTNNATAGLVGTNSVFSGIVQGEELGGEFQIVTQPTEQEVCPNQATTIEVVVQGANLMYQWQVNTGNGFTNIQDDGIYAGSNSSILTIREIVGDMMDYEFLLVVTSGCATNNIISEFITLKEGNRPLAQFDYTTNGLSVGLTNNSEDALSYLWDFGDGNTSTAITPTHTYAQDGEYTIMLTVENGCGSSSQFKTLYVGTAPFASFDADTLEGCTGTRIQYFNESSANATGLLWLFEGGTPGTSTAPDPQVTYMSGGSYNVTLIVSNPIGTDTLELIDYINIDGGPGTSFFTEVNDLTVEFINTSDNALSHLWDFGDGNTSTEFNPTHTYAEEGEYMIVLTSTNDCGTNVFRQNITTGLLPNADFTVENGAGCSPVEVQFIDRSSGTGLDQYQWTFQGGVPATSTEISPLVMYEQAGTYNVTLTITNNLGSSTTTKERIVTVASTPIANFDFDIDQNTVVFNNNSTDATSYGWGFGDASFSNEESPTHTYGETGLYYVTLNASNTFCGNSITIPVVISTVGVDALEAVPSLLVYPNPTTDRLFIRLQDHHAEALMFRIFDAQGRLVNIIEGRQGTDFELDMQSLSSGLYFVHTIAADWQQVLRVIKE